MMPRDRIPRSRDDHADVIAARAKRLEDLQAIYFRKGEVEDRQSVRILARKPEPLIAIPGSIHRIALAPQPFFDSGSQDHIILYE